MRERKGGKGRGGADALRGVLGLKIMALVIQ